jgi:hypothetical protein
MAESERELAERLAEELTRLRVEDVLIQTIVTVSAVGYRRLGVTPDTKDNRDLDQARLAIETMRTLTPLLEQVVPAELVRDFNSSVASLQLAYAKVAAEAAGETTEAPATPPEAPATPPEGDPATPPEGDPATPPEAPATPPEAPATPPEGDPATPPSSGSTESPTGSLDDDG